MVSVHWPKAPTLEVAALATGLATMLVAALVPWVSLQAQPVHRNPDTPVVRLRDGRNVAYQVYGDHEGKHLAFWFHGTPSCRLEGQGLSEEILRQLSLKMIVIDRPGYGQSDPHPSRNYSTFADDVGQVADAFGAERFFIAGASGGGPYALAATYYLQNRVLATAVNCAAGNWGALNETERAQVPLTQRQKTLASVLTFLSRRPGFKLLFRAVVAIPRVHRFVYEQGLKGWNNMATSSMTEGDIECLDRPPAYWGKHVRPESLRQETSVPWIRDHVLFFREWPFNISQFSTERQARIFMAHGLADKIVFPAFSAALKRRMPHAHLELIPGKGHFDYYICDRDFQRRMFESLLHSAGVQADV